MGRVCKEGVTEEAAAALAIEFPAFFTMPAAARERIGFLVGEVRLEPHPRALLARRRVAARVLCEFFSVFGNNFLQRAKFVRNLQEHLRPGF